MGFNFPNAPSNGALFTPIAGGPTYTWDAATTAWKLASAGLSSGVYTGDIAPAAPVSGMLWLNSTTGIVYFWYVDPNSSQWVAISGGAPASVKTARTRNRVINPTAQVSQESGTTATGTNGTYPADQWYFGVNGITGTAQRAITFGPTPEGTTSGVILYASVAKASLAASDHLQLALPVEGLDVADLGWGTANAKAVVLRFAANCDTAGTYGFVVHNNANDRCYCGSFAYTATPGTWQVFSFAVPGDTTGTWLKDTGVGVLLRFTYAVGSTYVGVAGWQGGSLKMQPSGCTNGAAVANSVLRITDVGLYSDPDATGVAPRFEAPSYEDDLARCQRYYEQSKQALIGISINANQKSWHIEKRVQPSLSTIGALNGATVSTTLTDGWYQPNAASTATQVTVVGNARLI